MSMARHNVAWDFSCLPDRDLDSQVLLLATLVAPTVYDQQ